MADVESMDVSEAIISGVDGEASGELAGNAASGGASTEGIEEADPFVSYIEQLAQAETGGGAQGQKPPAQEPEKMPEGVDPETPAGQRWQKLANERREAVQAATQMQTQLGQVQQYVQQVQQTAQQQVNQIQQQAGQAIQALQVQIAEMKGQMQAGKQKVELDPVEKLKQEWLEGARGIFKQELTPLQERNAALEKQWNDRQQQEETSKLSNSYQATALKVAQEIVCKGLDETTAKEISPRLTGLILATQLHSDATPEKAAAIVRDVLMKFGVGFVRANSKAFASAQKKSAGLPPPPARGRVNGKGEAMPSLEQLRAAGYRDEFEWMADQKQ